MFVMLYCCVVLILINSAHFFLSPICTSKKNEVSYPITSTGLFCRVVDAFRAMPSSLISHDLGFKKLGGKLYHSVMIRHPSVVVHMSSWGHKTLLGDFHSTQLPVAVGIPLSLKILQNHIVYHNDTIEHYGY